MRPVRYLAIADDLRDRVGRGEFAAGRLLPSESELGAAYDASRVTVRKALELLRERGLVESRRGAGWFVAGGSFRQRLALGSFRHAASAVAESGHRLARQVVSFGWQPLPAYVAGPLDLADGDEALHCRSVRTVEGRPLDLVDEWVPGPLAGSLSRDDATDPGSERQADDRSGASPGPQA